jgi:hypothetical protein
MNRARAQNRAKLHANVERLLKRRMPLLLGDKIRPYARAYMQTHAPGPWPEAGEMPDAMALAEVITRQSDPANDKQSSITEKPVPLDIPYAREHPEEH